MNRAAIYVRVSHHSQLDGTSLADQERVCREYAAAHNLQVVKVYRDAGRSAYNDELNARPEFERMIRESQIKIYSVILVYKLDRFARKARIYHNELHMLERAGIQLRSATEPNAANAAGRLTNGMLAEFAEFYSRQLSERVTLSYAARAKRGDYIGNPPFGYIKADRSLAWGPLAMWATAIFVAYGELGHTSTAIAAALNAAGVPLTSGRPWGRESVLGILHNRAYIGMGYWRGLGHYPSNHAPLVSVELFEACQAKLGERRRGPAKARRVVRSPELDFQAVCAKCGASMRKHWGGSSASARAYFRCSAADNRLCDARGVALDRVVEQVELLRRGGSFIETVELLAPKGVVNWKAPKVVKTTSSAS